MMPQMLKLQLEFGGGGLDIVLGTHSYTSTGAGEEEPEAYVSQFKHWAPQSKIS